MWDNNPRMKGDHYLPTEGNQYMYLNQGVQINYFGQYTKLLNHIVLAIN